MTDANMAILRHQQEQDAAHALKWWRETSEPDKELVWSAIQSLGGSPINEVVSRFAQLGMTQIALMDAEA